MSKEELKLQYKATALNAIRKLYHPLAKPVVFSFSEGETSSDVRDGMVHQIIEQLEKDLISLK
ncbi:hypothetical protein M0Q50_08595 [bacterium]|jgi:hypothetical protein|nr:hypothetical protein [bacterium]